jgi:hypothetical protein
MATIQKTYTTSLESVTVLADSVRASVAVRDTADPTNVAARMMIMVKGGKVLQPAAAASVPVDPGIATAGASLLAAFASLSDAVVAAAPIFIRGSIPPTRPASLPAAAQIRK